MAKSFIDEVQVSPRTGLGIPVKTKKKTLSRTILPLTEPLFGYKLHERLVPVSSYERLFRHPFAGVSPPRRRACSAIRGAAKARDAWKY